MPIPNPTPSLTPTPNPQTLNPLTPNPYPGEEKLALTLCRLKKHRWHKRVLKSADPLVFSVGWRRFQSCPLYCTKDPNLRLRHIKYTPEHMHCLAAFYGPNTPPNTGILCFQAEKKKGFRVCATGVVLELEASIKVSALG